MEGHIHEGAAHEPHSHEGCGCGQQDHVGRGQGQQSHKECGCGQQSHESHEHHHHHGEIQEEEEVGKVRFTRHEGALVCNAIWELSGDFLSVQQEVGKHMDALADWVEKEEGIIGHIKCFLEEKLRSSMLSTTGDGVNCVDYQDNRVEVQLTVIVYAEDAARLCKKIEEFMEIH